MSALETFGTTWFCTCNMAPTTFEASAGARFGIRAYSIRSNVNGGPTYAVTGGTYLRVAVEKMV